jgi:hypothetical protein
MGEPHEDDIRGSVPSPPPIGGDGTDEPPPHPEHEHHGSENGHIPPDLFTNHDGTPHYTLDDQPTHDPNDDLSF